MTDIPDDLHDRVDDFHGTYHYYGSADENTEPYRELLEDYDPATVLAAFKAGGFGTCHLHRHMDMVLLAAVNDDQTTNEFLNTTRWYE